MEETAAGFDFPDLFGFFFSFLPADVDALADAELSCS